jgi:hypothetical protein
VRKLIAFDDDTYDKLKQLGRDRMGTELADQAFADLLRKHGIPVDLKDALRKSALSAAEARAASHRTGSRKARSRPIPVRSGKAGAPRERTFPLKPIPTRTAAMTMRCGPPVNSNANSPQQV